MGGKGKQKTKKTRSKWGAREKEGKKHKAKGMGTKLFGFLFFLCTFFFFAFLSFSCGLAFHLFFFFSISNGWGGKEGEELIQDGSEMGGEPKGGGGKTLGFSSFGFLFQYWLLLFSSFFSFFFFSSFLFFLRERSVLGEGWERLSGFFSWVGF